MDDEIIPLDSYKITMEHEVIDINIYRDKKGFSHYDISVKNISKHTNIILRKIREEFISEIAVGTIELGEEGEGEGDLTHDGSIHENACSSGITGMMTSIARDIIPQGVSVNGIALGPSYENDLERIIWATHLWLSGMAEYSCAQILRLY